MRSKCTSIEEMGTADPSIVSSPVMASDKEHWVDILPVTRNPPIQQYFLLVMGLYNNIFLILQEEMVKFYKIKCNTPKSSNGVIFLHPGKTRIIIKSSHIVYKSPKGR